MVPFIKTIQKTLSPNDLGLTGSHQAGILIPKNEEILSFFPVLDGRLLNPRVRLSFMEPSGDRWFLNFIYYNNKYFGGTRDEFRLTGLTAYFRQTGCLVGDILCMSLDENNDRFIDFKRNEDLYTYRDGVLHIHSGWRVF